MEKTKGSHQFKKIYFAKKWGLDLTDDGGLFTSLWRLVELGLRKIFFPQLLLFEMEMVVLGKFCVELGGSRT